jgi:hypothetical protein
LTGRVLNKNYWYSGLLGGGLSGSWGSHVLGSGRVLDSGYVFGVVAFLMGKDY